MTTTEMAGRPVVEKIDQEVLRKAAKKLLDNDFDGKGPGYIADRLLKHFSATYEKKDMVDCNDCDGRSPNDLERCPYCGAVDEDAANGASNGSNGKHAVGPLVTGPQAIALAGGARVTIVVEQKSLDEAVTEANRLKANMAGGIWFLGKYVFEKIYAPQLWTLRTDADGKAVYKSFKAFCEQELGLSANTIYLFMEISQKFNEEEARSIGQAKLKYILRAPASAQAELLGKAKDGATRREIESGAREAQVLEGSTSVRDGLGAKTKKGASAKRASEAARNARSKRPPRTAGTTVILPEGKFTAKLWKRPEKKGDEPKPARRVGDRPVARIECLNEGMVLLVALVESASGQLVLSLEAKKVE
jgi:hypothetical protein